MFDTKAIVFYKNLKYFRYSTIIYKSNRKTKGLMIKNERGIADKMNSVKSKKFTCILKIGMIQYKQIEQIIQMIQIKHKLQILHT